VGRLDDLDLSLRLSRSDEQKRLDAAWPRLVQLRLTLGGQLGGGLGPALLVIFEGWDASGKGGCIKNLVTPLDPRHVRVAQFASPTPDEKRHHFLFRFIPKMPGLGGMAVFDRSWYGRVLVERVEGYATVEQWQRAYREIVDFERSAVLEGMIVIKFWLHISFEEQLRRFRRREADPLKRWKLTDDDWRNRGRIDDYRVAVEEMLARTDHEHAPWHLIEAESKRFARVKVVETSIAAIEEGMRRRGFDPPPPLPQPAFDD
jgi:polyphosphate kinase 2 (PPK2 family)